MTKLSKEEETHGWGTKSELDYLDGLGRGKGKDGKLRHSNSKMPRKQLLVNYRSYAQVRHRWGGIDKAAVIAYVNKTLREEFSI